MGYNALMGFAYLASQHTPRIESERDFKKVYGVVVPSGHEGYDPYKALAVTGFLRTQSVDLQLTRIVKDAEPFNVYRMTPEEIAGLPKRWDWQSEAGLDYTPLPTNYFGERELRVQAALASAAMHPVCRIVA